MWTPDAGSDFRAWIDGEFAEHGAFTAGRGGLLDDAAAQVRLIEIEQRATKERQALNQGFSFDRHGQRIMLEVGPQ